MFWQGNPFVGSDGSFATLNEHRPLPKSIAAQKKLAERLANAPGLNREQRNTLVALGRVAYPYLLKVCRSTKGSRFDEMTDLLTKVAVPADTQVIWELYKPFDKGLIDDKNPFIHTPGFPMLKWLQENGDPGFLGPIYFPKFMAGGEMQKELALPILTRSRDHKVVDTLFSILKDPQQTLNLRQKIYQPIAQSERPDVLNWLLHERNQKRTLSVARTDVPQGQDSDGDGIEDRLDINAYAAPRPLSDAEKVIQVAFEAEVHFWGPNPGLAYFGFSANTQPFELYGWDGPMLPAQRFQPVANPKVEVHDRYPFASIAFSPVQMNGPDHAEVSVGIVTGPLTGGGALFALRKIRGEWFVVSVKDTWAA